MMEQEVIQQILEYVQRADSFAVEQAPLLCQELIQWAIYSSIGGAVLGGVVLLLGVFLCWLALRDDDGFLFGPEHLIAITGFVVLVCSIVHIIYVLTAPRVFLLEKLTSMLPS